MTLLDGTPALVIQVWKDSSANVGKGQKKKKGGGSRHGRAVLEVDAEAVRDTALIPGVAAGLDWTRVKEGDVIYAANPATVTTALSAPAASSASPQIPDIVSGCDKHHQIQSGASFWSIDQGGGITGAQCMVWNSVYGLELSVWIGTMLWTLLVATCGSYVMYAWVEYPSDTEALSFSSTINEYKKIEAAYLYSNLATMNPIALHVIHQGLGVIYPEHYQKLLIPESVGPRLLL